MKPVLTILDDYQSVARDMADWSGLEERFDMESLTEHVADPDRLVERLGRSEVVIAMRERTPFPASVLGRLPRLRLLVTTGMGNASIDLDAARANGITVSGTGGAGNGVVELVIGMMIALTRSFAAEDRAVREGGWQHTIGPGLAGRTLGVVGLGRLGRPVASLARAFQMDVIAWSPHLTEERAAGTGVRVVDRAQLFSEADIVTIHLPLAPGTRGLIGAAELALMKATAYLVNTSRGPIVDEDALIEALSAGRIAGVGLDVYDTEPLPAGHPLRRLPNTLLLPHIGYVTTDAYRAFYGDAVEDVQSFYAGAPLRVLN